MFTSEVQFGHAGSCANSDKETAVAKNAALRAAGANVPDSFDYLGDVIHSVYNKLVQDGTIVPEPEVPPPTVPMDYSWARVRMRDSSWRIALLVWIGLLMVINVCCITGIRINT